VPAQRQYAAARPAHVAEQQLDDRPGADVLDADAVLGPAHRVDQRGGALPARVGRPGLAHLEELLLRYAADPLDHLRGVAGVVPLEHLVHAARVLQGRVAAHAVVHRRAVRLVFQTGGRLPVEMRLAVVAAPMLVSLVRPARLVVGVEFLVVAENSPSRSSVSRKSSLSSVDALV